MRLPTLYTPVTVRFLRAICWYGFVAACVLYLLALAVEQFRPGAFSLSVSLTTLFKVSLVLGVCTLIMPKPTPAFTNQWGRGPALLTSIVIASVVSLHVVRSAVVGWVSSILLFVVVSGTSYNFIRALVDDDFGKV